MFYERIHGRNAEQNSYIMGGFDKLQRRNNGEHNSCTDITNSYMYLIMQTKPILSFMSLLLLHTSFSSFEHHLDQILVLLNRKQPKPTIIKRTRSVQVFQSSNLRRQTEFHLSSTSHKVPGTYRSRNKGEFNLSKSIHVCQIPL